MVADGLSMDEAIERIAFPENPEKWTMPAADAAAIAAE
jgi:conjugal transfer ATP-binding protein TraC